MCLLQRCVIKRPWSSVDLHGASWWIIWGALRPCLIKTPSWTTSCRDTQDLEQDVSIRVRTPWHHETYRSTGFVTRPDSLHKVGEAGKSCEAERQRCSAVLLIHAWVFFKDVEPSPHIRRGLIALFEEATGSWALPVVRAGGCSSSPVYRGLVIPPTARIASYLWHTTSVWEITGLMRDCMSKGTA